MPIANCKRCGRIYNRVRRDICPSCILDEDKWFNAVKTYLHEHRDASLLEVSGGTGVATESIVEMIRDGRLILRDHPNMSYGCERCGKPTQSGRYCAACSKALSEELSHTSSPHKTHNTTAHSKKNGYRSST